MKAPNEAPEPFGDAYSAAVSSWTFDRGRGQMDHDAPDGALHTGGDFERPLAQRPDLSIGAGRAGGPPPQLWLTSTEVGSAMGKKIGELAVKSVPKVTR